MKKTRALLCLALLTLPPSAPSQSTQAPPHTGTQSSSPTPWPDFSPVHTPSIPDFTVLSAGSQEAYLQQRTLAQQLGCPIEMTNALGMSFRLIPPPPLPEDNTAQSPPSAPLWVGTCEVTQQQWTALMHSNPSHFSNPANPVEQVSWHDCIAFLERLNEEFGGGYRLLTPDEWEYCCRAGTTTPFCFGHEIFSNLVNFNPNYLYGDGEEANKLYRGHPLPAGSLPPNAWGLHDMHGNLWEWCDTPQKTQPIQNGQSRLPTQKPNCGGAWFNSHQFCHSSTKEPLHPESKFPYLGFRIAREPHGCIKMPSRETASQAG